MEALTHGCIIFNLLGLCNPFYPCLYLPHKAAVAREHRHLWSTVHNIFAGSHLRTGAFLNRVGVASHRSAGLPFLEKGRDQAGTWSGVRDADCCRLGGTSSMPATHASPALANGAFTDREESPNKKRPIKRPLENTNRSRPVRQAGWRLPISPSDFGVEIGGSPTFEDLPGSIHQSEKTKRKLCVGCHQHHALFKYRGRVRWDRDHTLCFRCYRSAMDRLVAISVFGSQRRAHE